MVRSRRSKPRSPCPNIPRRPLSIFTKPPPLARSRAARHPPSCSRQPRIVGQDCHAAVWTWAEALDGTVSLTVTRVGLAKLSPSLQGSLRQRGGAAGFVGHCVDQVAVKFRSGCGRWRGRRRTFVSSSSGEILALAALSFNSERTHP